MTKITLLVVSLLPPVALAMLVTAPTDKEWPIFRGNSSQSGFIDREIRTPLHVDWKFSTKDAIEGAAACMNGKIVFGSMDEKVYCLDESNGKEIWSTKTGPIKASPSIHKNVVYIGNVDGAFHALDFNTGKILWTFQTNGEISGGANFFEDTLLIGSQDENLYCLNLHGKEVWKFKMDGPFFGSCAVKDGKTFAAGCDSTLHVIDAKSGKELNSLDLGGQTGATAAISGNELFVGTMSNNVLGIDWKKPAIRWTYQTEKRAQPFFSSCAISDSLIFVGSRDKKLHAISRNDGREKWTILTDGKIDSSPLIFKNKIAFGSFDGNLYIAATADGSILQKLNLGGEIASSPIACGTSLVVGTMKGDLVKLSFNP